MRTKIRRLLLCAPLFMLTGEMPPQPPVATTGDFCSRLAANSGIDRPAAPDGRTTWTADALTFGQRFLIGGSAATSVNVNPLNPTTVEDYQRLEHMCQPERKGAICKLVGPVNFEFSWKGQRSTTQVGAGERATVSVFGTKTTCQVEAP